MATLKDRLRDPVWQFIGVLVTIAALVLSVVVWVKPNFHDAAIAPSPSISAKTTRSIPASTSVQPMVPATYRAAAPGPGCDNGGARWTLEEGRATCAGQRAAYERAFVWFDWPGNVLAPSYEITLNADRLAPTTCVRLLVRGGYSFIVCAMGDVSIGRVRPGATLAAKQFPRAFTYAQITARVEKSTLTLTVYTNGNGDTILLTVSDDVFTHEDWIELGVYTVSTRPAKAELYDFTYRAIVDSHSS